MLLPRLREAKASPTARSAKHGRKDVPMQNEKRELLPLDEQQEWNEANETLATRPLPSKKQWEDLMTENSARGLTFSNAPSSSSIGLVESVMARHGFTEEKALELLDAFKV
jgi:hypothetical protein